VDGERTVAVTSEVEVEVVGMDSSGRGGNDDDDGTRGRRASGAVGLMVGLWNGREGCVCGRSMMGGDGGEVALGAMRSAVIGQRAFLEEERGGCL
jgi:hypothetical protein